MVTAGLATETPSRSTETRLRGWAWKTGDTTHHQILLTETPRTEFVYDTDPKQAVASRLKVLDMLASQKMPLHAYHFPWPGYGYVAKQGDGYRYYPAPMEIVRVPPKQT
jgi:hypothetical protein